MYLGCAIENQHNFVYIHDVKGDDFFSYTYGYVVIAFLLLYMIFFPRLGF